MVTAQDITEMLEQYSLPTEIKEKIQRIARREVEWGKYRHLESIADRVRGLVEVFTASGLEDTILEQRVNPYVPSRADSNGKVGSPCRIFRPKEQREIFRLYHTYRGSVNAVINHLTFPASRSSG